MAKTKKTSAPKAKLVDHVFTQEDIAANPELAEQGIVEGDVIQQPEEVVSTLEDTTTADSATVHYRGTTRTYSRDVHGPEFMEKAKSFATKFNGTIE